jgi:hypothetical protein
MSASNLVVGIGTANIQLEPVTGRRYEIGLSEGLGALRYE